jgi:hypothetical protein
VRVNTGNCTRAIIYYPLYFASRQGNRTAVMNGMYNFVNFLLKDLQPLTAYDMNYDFRSSSFLSFLSQKENKCKKKKFIMSTKFLNTKIE